MYNELLKEKGATIVMMVTNFLKARRIMWKQDNSHHTPDIFIYPYSQPQIKCTNYIKICINISRIYHKFLNNMFHICEEIFSVHFALLPGVHDYLKKNPRLEFKKKTRSHFCQTEKYSYQSQVRVSTAWRMVKHVNNANHQKQEPTDMDPRIFYGLWVTKNSPHKTLVRTMRYSKEETQQDQGR